MNRRRPSTVIAEAEAVALVRAYDFARAIGKKLDWMLTLRLSVDGLDERGRCDALLAARHRISIAFDRADAGKLHAIWAREVGGECGAEHLHILAFAPVASRNKILDQLVRWWPAPRAVCDKDMPLEPRRGRDGRLVFGPGYIVKTQSRQASCATGFCRRASGGVLVGKRAGCTRNLAAPAIAAHAAEHRASAEVIQFPIARRAQKPTTAPLIPQQEIAA